MRLQEIIRKEIREQCDLDSFYGQISMIIKQTTDINTKTMFQGALTYFRLIHSIEEVDCEFDAWNFMHKRIQYRKKLNSLLINSAYNSIFIKFLIRLEDIVDEYISNYRLLAV